MANAENHPYDSALFTHTCDALYDTIPAADDEFSVEAAGHVCLEYINSLQEQGMSYPRAAGLVTDAISEIRGIKLAFEALNNPGDILHG